MFQLKVLVADSNRPSLSLYTDILEKMGFSVDSATDGNSALHDARPEMIRFRFV